MMYTRDFNLEARASADALECSLSSEFPVERSWGLEILEHTAQAVDLKRAPLPLIESHDPSRLPVGTVENLRVAGGKLRGTLRFGKSQRAQELQADAQSGVLRSLSIGYQVHKTERHGDEIRVVRWQPYECSLVSVPADPTVGIGRSLHSSGDSTMLDHDQTASQDAPLSRSQRIAANQAARDASARNSDIAALGRQFDAMDDALSAIERGASVEEFRRHLLSKLQPAPSFTPGDIRNSSLGMSSREIRGFSVLRALAALMDDTPGGEFRRKAGLELEASRAWQQQSGNERGGISIPPDVLLSDDFFIKGGQRDLVVGTASAGGNLVSTTVLASNFIELLRKKSVIFDLGATVLSDLVGEIRLPRQAGGATGYWVGENGTPSESQMSVDQVPLSPKSIGTYTDFSRRLALQSSMDVEMLVRNDLAVALALGIEQAAFAGTGAGSQPIGILNTSGVGAVVLGANGAAPDWATLVDLQASVELANVDLEACAWVMNAKTRAKLLKTQQFAGTSGANVYEAAQAIGRIGVSQHMPSDLTKGSSVGVCSAMIYGDFSQLVIGMWGGLDLILDPYTNATSGGKRVIAFQDVDIGVRRGGAFAVCKEILTS